MAQQGKIIPVLLSGGTGTRLWPLSREARPKQFQALAGQATLIQESALRSSDPQRFGRTIVIANAAHRFLVAEQLRQAGVADPQIVLEPVGRNTAPAVAVAALLSLREDSEALILVAPADHVIADRQRFLDAVDSAAAAARAGRLTLFGIKPTAPATGYGYIRMGPEIAEAPGAFQVAQFVEKPDLEKAQGFVASQDYVWNSGIFLMPARLLIEELNRFEPHVLEACRSALQRSLADADFLRLDPASFERSPSISIDHAVMERTRAAAVVPSKFGWTDVGSWSALWEIGRKDADRNVTVGDVLAHGSAGCYLRSDGPLVAALGVEDLIVVATPDAILVAKKASDQGVKAVVERLRSAGHTAATESPSADRR